LKRKFTAEELVKVLGKDAEDNKKIALQRVNTVSRCIQRLDEIALRPNPFSTPQYIDLIIDAEQQEKRLGFKERIKSLKKLRQMAVITSKIKNRVSVEPTPKSRWPSTFCPTKKNFFCCTSMWIYFRPW
jgi:hypothetical protein